MNPTRLMNVLPALLAATLLWPSEAAAQWRYGPHARVSTFVLVGGGYGFYRPYFYDPFFWGGYPGWYPGWYSAYPPYPAFWGPAYGSARLQVTPKQAEVYVDGYYAGVVDDFDGIFQRLDVPPGRHEVTLYLDGYKALHQRVLFRAGDTVKLKAELQPLPAGEHAEPRPVAPPPQAAPPRGEYPPPGPGRTRPMPEAGAGQQPESGFGTLAIRVQPTDATIVIDGERWDSPEGGSRLQVQLSAGPHKIEVRKDGFKPYSTTVTIRPGASETLNVSLSAGDGAAGVPTLARR